MKYRLYKPSYDGSPFMCRVFLPDGFNRVFELTRWNHPFIEMLTEHHGYALEEVGGEVKCGLYEDASGRRCDERSVETIVKPLAPPNAHIVYLPDDAPEFDPVATVGVPKETWKRGYRPVAGGMVGKQLSNEEASFAIKEAKMRRRAQSLGDG